MSASADCGHASLAVPLTSASTRTLAQPIGCGPALHTTHLEQIKILPGPADVFNPLLKPQALG
jgi:hypothetical protein